MNRKKFLKSTVLGVMGLFLCPKDIFSTPISDTKNKLVKVDFKPNYDYNDTKIPEDLIEFAKEFSEVYNKLECSTYVSYCGKYRIDYLKEIRSENTNELLTTPYRVSHSTGIMEFNREKTINEPKSFVFNSIIWCYLMKESPHDYFNSDSKSIECTINNGFPEKELRLRYYQMLSENKSEFNKKRLISLNRKM